MCASDTAFQLAGWQALLSVPVLLALYAAGVGATVAIGVLSMCVLACVLHPFMRKHV